MKWSVFILFFVIPTLAFSQKDSTVSKLLNRASGLLKSGGASGGGLTTQEIAEGLKEALTVGATHSAQVLSAADGFFGNSLIKVLMPPEAQKVEKTLRSIGLGNYVDQAILSMNRAAEAASAKSVAIFVAAIRSMTIQDAVGILKGADSAATHYLRERSSDTLQAAFYPVIAQALQQTEATKYWKQVFEVYNKLPTTFTKVNPDLNSYVTDRALQGLFYQIGQEEKKIRKDPAARMSDLLKKVFSNY